MKFEQLIVFNDENTFCKDVSSFKKLLDVDSEIIVNNNRLLFKKEDFLLSITQGKIKTKKQRFFSVEVETDKSSESAISSKLNELRKKIKGIVFKVDKEVVVLDLWNDVSRINSSVAYMDINAVENLMRKLITKFMLITIGKDWSLTGVPSNIKDEINTKKSVTKYLDDILFQSDFIHLSDFLFKEYRVTNINSLDKHLIEVEKGKNLNKKLILDFLPKSNWDRYFKDILEIEGDELKKKWKQLYELRIKIAHNKEFSSQDLDNTIELSERVIEVVKKALIELDKISLSKNEKQNVIDFGTREIKDFYNRKFLNVPIEELGLSVRLYNCLRAFRIRSLSDLLEYKERELFRIRNYGRKSHAELDTLLKENGIKDGVGIFQE